MRIKKNIKYSIAICIMVCVNGNSSSIAMELEIDKTVISENWKERCDNKPQLLILHCVGLSDEWVFKNYGSSKNNGGLGVSAHYYVSQGKKIYQMVPEEKTAYHAGISEWRSLAQKNKLNGLNDLSIGIEFQSLGYAQINEEAYYPYSFASFSEEQINSGIVLCQQMMKEHDISPTNVVWHSDVSPLRKTDPGVLFDGKRLAEKGVGVWPSSDRLGDTQLDVSLPHIQGSLKEWGFPHIEKSGQFDETTKHVLASFYMHYLSEELNWGDYKTQKSGSIFSNIEKWEDFPFDKQKIAISLENLNNSNFEF